MKNIDEEINKLKIQGFDIANKLEQLNMQLNDLSNQYNNIKIQIAAKVQAKNTMNKDIKIPKAINK